MIFSIVLSLFGLLLIYLEFFLPGGIMAIAGGLLLIGSIVIVLISDVGAFLLIIFIAAVIAALLAVIKIALWQVRRTGKKGTVYLESDQGGYMASFYDKELIGKIGIVESNLRPSGYVAIEGKSYQAVSKGSYINQGTKVQVIGGEGARIIVRAIIEE